MKALFVDLDNTIYPAAPIGEIIFQPVWKRIAISGQHDHELDLIGQTMLQRPFQAVADLFDFSEELIHSCLVLLNQLEVKTQLEPFAGYEEIRKLAVRKYLVTTGFTKLQNSKIDQLGIRNDFEEIYIVDPVKGSLTKKLVFEQVLKKNSLKPEEAVVLGDDPNSELKAAKELGIPNIQLRYSERILPHDGEIVFSLQEAAAKLLKRLSSGFEDCQTEGVATL